MNRKLQALIAACMGLVWTMPVTALVSDPAAATSLMPSDIEQNWDATDGVAWQSQRVKMVLVIQRPDPGWNEGFGGSLGKASFRSLVK
jgi:hypothetical protein